MHGFDWIIYIDYIWYYGYARLVGLVAGLVTEADSILRASVRR